MPLRKSLIVLFSTTNQHKPNQKITVSKKNLILIKEKKKESGNQISMRIRSRTNSQLVLFNEIILSVKRHLNLPIKVAKKLFNPRLF